MIISKTLAITNERGLHARAAAKFVKTAALFQAAVTVYRNGMSVSGTSIMGLLLLAASQGTTIDVTANGDDADATLEALAALLADNFGEGQ